MARPKTVGLNCPSAYAKKLPKIALDNASGKVRNLNASIQTKICSLPKITEILGIS